DPELNRWRPWREFASYDLPTERLKKGREGARRALAQRGVPARQRLTAWSGVAARPPALASCLSAPLVGGCWPDRSDTTADLARPRLTAWFAVAARQPALASCRSEPRVVECRPDRSEPTRLMACYDVDRRHWSLVRCLRAEARRVDRQGRVMDHDTGLELWVVVERYGTRTDPEALAEAVLRLGA